MLEFLTKSSEVLGMNARNLNYIRPNNKKSAKCLADNKLLCKKKLEKAGLPVPQLLGKIRNHEELANFDFSSLPNSFVLKPNFGFGGEGIMVVYGRRKGEDLVWVKADGSSVTINDLKSQVQNILEGTFSRTGTPDIAFFEERIKLMKDFKPYSYKGMPDVRIIVYNRVPVMAMLRLATPESGGKANLQLGGIGCGIDIATGVTTTAIRGKADLIEYIPSTRLLLSGIKIPYWRQILEMAVQAQDVSGLGYLGADIALDRDRGPVFLELNARPGLSIQIANQEGLLKRLKRVEGLKIKGYKRGATLAQNLFGGEIEEGIEELSGKRVIGATEKVELLSKDGRKIEVTAKIDTGAWSTSIDLELAKKLGFSDLLDHFSSLKMPKNFSRKEVGEVEARLRKEYLKTHDDLEDIVVVYSSSGVTIRPKIKLKFIMDNESVFSRTNIVDRKDLKYPMLIGRRDLKKFLIEV